MRVIVTSNNPVKLNATKQAFSMMFPEEKFEFVCVSVPSGVPDQPSSDVETKLGATNRVNNVTEPADFIVGIEGGIHRSDGEVNSAAWAVIKHDDRLSSSRSATFPLPRRIIELLDEGKELGHASDIVFNHDNVKQKQGSIGILTDNAIDRVGLYIHPLCFALIPFKKKELF